jgi:hypothetical protein
MKKGSLWAALPVYLLFLSLQSCSTLKTANTPDRTLTDADYKEMIDNYDGKFRNHRKTGGLIIGATELTDILKRYEGQTVSLVFARYLAGDIYEGKKKRTTLLLVSYPDGIDKAPRYLDLGKTRLCPEPPDCVPSK